MGKKMKLPFLFRSSSDVTKPSSWSWPACNLQPRTLSFRNPDDVLKTMNPAYLDKESPTVERNVSWCTNSLESPSFSTQTEDQDCGGDQVEMVIRGLSSDRLFFDIEPGETSSILTNTTKAAEPSSLSLSEVPPFKENTMLMSMDSQDPYMDFKKSMEEMVEAHGLKNWRSLEELLFWYLRVNEKSHHEYILGAFIDLLVGHSIASSSSTTCIPISSSTDSYSPCTPLSFYTSNSSSSSTTPCVSSSRIEEEEEEVDIDVSCSCLSSPLEVEKKIVQVKDDVVSSYNYV